MKRVIAILQSVSVQEEVPEAEMLSPDYKAKLENRIALELASGEFAKAKDSILKLNLIDMHITQSYSDMDAGVKVKLDSMLEKAHSQGEPINRRFLECAAERYQRIIDRMDLDGQAANPALIEYLNLYATALELLGREDEALKVHDRIPTVMVAMLEQQKTQATKFCLAEKSYWDAQIESIEQETCLSYEQLKTAGKALRFYETKEATLCAVTHDEDGISNKISALKALVLGTKVA